MFEKLYNEFIIYLKVNDWNENGKRIMRNRFVQDVLILLVIIIFMIFGINQIEDLYQFDDVQLNALKGILFSLMSILIYQSTIDLKRLKVAPYSYKKDEFLELDLDKKKFINLIKKFGTDKSNHQFLNDTINHHINVQRKWEIVVNSIFVVLVLPTSKFFYDEIVSKILVKNFEGGILTLSTVLVFILVVWSFIVVRHFALNFRRFLYDVKILESFSANLIEAIFEINIVEDVKDGK